MDDLKLVAVTEHVVSEDDEAQFRYRHRPNSLALVKTPLRLRDMTVRVQDGGEGRFAPLGAIQVARQVKAGENLQRHSLHDNFVVFVANDAPRV
jgi:hypothetical protein